MSRHFSTFCILRKVAWLPLRATQSDCTVSLCVQSGLVEVLSRTIPFYIMKQGYGSSLRLSYCFQCHCLLQVVDLMFSGVRNNFLHVVCKSVKSVNPQICASELCKPQTWDESWVSSVGYWEDNKLPPGSDRTNSEAIKSEKRDETRHGNVDCKWKQGEHFITNYNKKQLKYTLPWSF